MVVIVSEETGAISVAVEGMLKRHMTPATLEKVLRGELIMDENETAKRGLIYNLRKLFKVKKNEE